MDISDLQVFKAVVEAGGISRAAEQLHRVPSNVTTRIQKLEESLGLALFNRERNRLRITPAGTRLLAYAEQMLQLRQQALDDLTSPVPAGTLRLGSMESTAAARLPSILVDFHARFDKVELELATGASGPLVDRVLQGKLDVALVADPVDDHRLLRLPCFEEQLVVVKPASLAHTRGPGQLPEPLTVVGFTQGCSYRDRIERWLATAHRRCDRLIEIPSHHTMLACVLAGMGVAMVPKSVLALHPTITGLSLEDPDTEIAEATTYLVWRRDSALPAITALRDILAKPTGAQTSR
ncbi:MAG: LysR family transcriptional regulator [Oceanospirillaceae bacterium]|nr:LysR family transcriptional regulator [Oceanospirillaceae bacterium]